MPAFICTACGAQFTPSETPPAHCPICEDERQYVPPRGQTWTTLPALAASHFNSYREHEPGVIGIGTQPAFAIGQRALLLRTAGGNVLWDCISFVDAATVTLVGALGGIKAIAISHPHFYTANGGVEPGVRRRADPPSCRGPRLDHAARSRHPAVGRRDPGAHARRHTGSLRRAFPGRHRAALGPGRGRARRIMLGRHRGGRPRPQVARLHEELPEFHSAVRRRGRRRSRRRSPRSRSTPSTGIISTG